MKKQFYFLTCLFCLAVLFNPFVLSAQSSNTEDVVYLKNGGIIRGTIIEQVPNQSLKIEIIGRNVLVFKFEEIEKIVKESAANEKAQKPNEDETFSRGKFSFIVESNLGFLLKPGGTDSGLKSGSGASLGIGLVFAANLHPKFSLGIGAGADLIGGSLFVPMFLDLRYYFTQKTVTPYFSFSGGWAIGEDYRIEGPTQSTTVSIQSDGGIYLNPNFGIRWNVAPKSALNFGIGARLQGNNGRITAGYSSQRYGDLLPLVNLKIGAIF